MQKRREWALSCLFEHYVHMGEPEPETRLGELLLLLPELEVGCNQHIKDFQVAQLFDISNMSEYWYERVCYTSVSVSS